MANNRMYLKHKRSGKFILLCKFYPSTRWYMFTDETKLNAWLEETTEIAVYKYGADDLFGPTDYELEFEIVEEIASA